VLATRTVLVTAIVAAGLMVWTANLGGRIRHAEIRPEAAQNVPGNSDEGEGR
jgi:hypothetical protein